MSGLLACTGPEAIYRPFTAQPYPADFAFGRHSRLYRRTIGHLHFRARAFAAAGNGFC